MIGGYACESDCTDHNVDESYVEVDGHILRFDSGEGPFFDDLTKQELPPLLVKAARRKELQYFEDKHVWKRVPIAEALRVSGRSPVTVRWVDVYIYKGGKQRT